MYRAALAKLDPALCEELDQRAVDLGQGWARPQLVEIDLEQLLTAQEVADLCAVKVGTVTIWRQRGLTATTTADGLRYRMADVLAYQAAIRRRRIAKAGGPQPGMFAAPGSPTMQPVPGVGRPTEAGSPNARARIQLTG